MKFAGTTALMLLLAMSAAQTGAAITLQMTVLTMAALAMAPLIQFRPQLFDFIALSALLMLLARDNYRRVTRLWLAIPLFVLWANLHGGFFVGIAVLIMYTAAVGIEELAAGIGFRHASYLGAVTATCTLATLLNPYGIVDWLTVIRTLTNPLTRAVVSDWQPLFFKIAEEWHRSPKTAVNFALAIVPFTALWICVAIRPRGGDLALLVIAAAMGLAACLAVRNMALAVIATVVPLCRHAGLVSQTADSGTFSSPTRRSCKHEMSIGALALAIAITTGLFSRGLPDGFPQPHGAVRFVQANGLRGNVLNDFAWGEFLIFHLGSRCKVFVDSRYDMVYPRKIVDDYLDFFLVHPRAAAVLTAYPHDFVMMRTGSRAYVFLSAQPGWRLIYRDSTAVLFAAPGLALPSLKSPPMEKNAVDDNFP